MAESNGGSPRRRSGPTVIATVLDRTPLRLPDRPQLSDAVASYLRDLIMSGQLSGGEFLRLDHLAQALEVSATPVREALLTLRGEGFVQLAPRRGFIVVPLTEGDIRDLFLAQSQTAGELAARTARLADAATLDEIAHHQATLRNAADAHDLAGIEEANYHFHRTLNLAAKSPKLTWLLGVAVRYVPRQTYPSIEGWPQASVVDHEAILGALRERDPERARATMSSHIVNAGDLLVAHLRSAGRLLD